MVDAALHVLNLVQDMTHTYELMLWSMSNTSLILMGGKRGRMYGIVH